MLEPWQVRVELEYRELSEKVKALRVFCLSSNFLTIADEDKELLIVQLSAMKLYKGTLEQRLNRMGYYCD
jgi:hypothetical protein